ncbi:MAG: transporter ATP-binding protein [Alphaproteobacteria bacterium]|nr:transporter ATP-binding protein [Alphaproteobacteria bacterium]
MSAAEETAGAAVTATDLALPGRLSPVSLMLAPGELTCLIGPNGSGKTSLLHALAGIGRPHGAVRIGGIDPRGLTPAARSTLLAYLPATRDIAWPLVARDLVALGDPASHPGAGSNAQVDAVLALLELGDVADRRLDRLSTGERSRVLLARALVAGSKLLLLDEPTANLDPLWQYRAMDHVRRLVQRERRVALVALHDLDIAARYADRLLIMDRGRLIADGSPRELLASATISAVFGVERGPDGWRPSI